ncbi:hypothetical protein CGCF415_v003552 [Colletotrichum fructicola]|uniref:Uncharacterized protein n=1 Tax=Colletotrichum fructicola (strain Nara gc5) TaxID=1213859 RepID=L2FIR0_COLFN|nr:uncharacterized protein CGMCC3_g4276 [Colletotrichum fructicola]KAF4487140.1 hypothetical protein CGGC5_v006526 [Colletotrichum fructicola Nara gc5]KAI8277548.1 hypothetical protein K4K60_006917 [Colletotrichum sp. SAR11_57]KAE9579876.1 hypothetical protein CGMCC3_g4276 [Colletotrichum fructicola]KAF4429208.1 hypothetical protein CFRS1_v007124 [Colletotrichum fructicola]KAF4891323.1 hypothetical protein CGCFRS4_v008242 [Colletotrichum fructicola]
MLFSKLQILSYLALAQLCASAAVDTAQDIAPRGDAFRDNYGSNMCLQVKCDTTVCAENPDDALAVASGGVSLIVGPDCAGWDEGSLLELPNGTNGKTCPDGRKLYQGTLMVWRAWNNVSAKKDYHAEFLEWDNFKGAQCWGKKDVQCQKDGVKMAPDPNTGLCVPWGL